MTTTIWRNANVATFCGDTPYGWLPGATIVTRGAEVIWLGADRDLPATLTEESANKASPRRRLRDAGPDRLPHPSCLRR